MFHEHANAMRMKVLMKEFATKNEFTQEIERLESNYYLKMELNRKEKNDDTCPSWLFLLPKYPSPQTESST